MSELAKPTLGNRLLIVFFGDGRLKVGVSTCLRNRVADFRQEARRNDVESVVWWASAPFPRSSHACRAKRILCDVLTEHALPRHRDCFRGKHQLFAETLKAGEELRARFASADEVVSDLPFLGSHGCWLASREVRA